MTREPLPRWIRLVAATVLGVPHLIIGFWGFVGRQSFYDDFPGSDPTVINAWPPFNDHLVNDTAIGFIATGVGVLIAAAFADRRSMCTALGVFISFAGLHLIFHVFNPSDLLSDSEHIVNLISLALSPTIAIVLIVAVWRRGGS